MSTAYDDQYAQKLQRKNDIYRQFDRNQIYIASMLENVPTGSKILDIATGISDIPQRISSAGYKAVGIDMAEDVNEQYRSTDQISNAIFVKGDALALPFKQNEFMGVIVKDFVEHLSLTEIEVLFAEINKVLAPNGVLVIGCPVKTFSSVCLRLYNRLTIKNFEGIDDTGDETHKQWFTEESLFDVIRKGLNTRFLDKKYLMYGVNNFPRYLISPLNRLQRILHRDIYAKNYFFKTVQRNFGFRIVITLLKN